MKKRPFGFILRVFNPSTAFQAAIDSIAKYKFGFAEQLIVPCKGLLQANSKILSRAEACALVGITYSISLFKTKRIETPLTGTFENENVTFAVNVRSGLLPDTQHILKAKKAY